MNVLIVAATEFEITSDKIKNNANLVTGIGMINTAINLTKELIHKKFDLVINIGVAGSFSNKLKNGIVVEVIEDCFSEIGYEDGDFFSELSNFNLKTKYKVDARTSLKKVNAVTVNTVHGNEKSISKIIKGSNPDIESMEGAAVFKVCEEFNTPCMQIRSISNKIEKRNRANWDLDLAIRNLNIEVERIIHNL
jgi:futalosine hydrolase